VSNGSFYMEAHSWGRYRLFHHPWSRQDDLACIFPSANIGATPPMLAEIVSHGEILFDLEAHKKGAGKQTALRAKGDTIFLMKTC
jgi:hypothetical protein